MNNTVYKMSDDDEKWPLHFSEPQRLYETCLNYPSISESEAVEPGGVEGATSTHCGSFSADFRGDFGGCTCQRVYQRWSYSVWADNVMVEQ